MADKTPVRVVFNSDGVATGLGEFQSSETIPIANGGTGLASLGSAGQVLKVDAAGTGLEFGDQGDIDVIASSDSTGVQVQDDLNISGAITSAGNITTGGSFIIGSASINETDLEKIDGITNGAGAANKALVLDASANVASGLADLTASGTITAAGFTIGSAAINEAELETIDGVTAGTVAASKAVVVDSDKDIASFRNVTATGSFIIGSADMNETDLEKLDGITNGTAAANKAIVLDGSKNIGTLGAVTATTFVIGSADINETDLEQIDGLTAGTVTASKAVVVDANKDAGTFRNITASGTVEALTLTATGTLNANIIDAQIFQTSDSTAIQINEGINVSGAIVGASTAKFTGDVTLGGNIVDEVPIQGATPHLTLLRTDNANVPSVRFKGSGGSIGASIEFDGTSGTANELVFKSFPSSLTERFRVTLTGAKVTGNLDVTTNLAVAGDLTVSGTTTSVNTTNLEIQDALIELNKNNSGGSDVDAGLYIQRGSAGNNAAFYWNEGDDKFKAVLTTSDADATSITDSSTATIVANIEGASANLSGTVTFGSLSDGAITVTAFVDEDDMSSNSATLIPTQQSVKAYVDSEVSGASGGALSVVGDDSSTFELAVGTDTLQFSGGTNIATATTSSKIVTINLDADITIDSFTIGSAAINETDITKIDAITNGTAAANKAVVLDGSKNIGTLGAVTATSFVIGSADINESDLEQIDGLTAGTVAASKAVVVDSDKDASGFRNITAPGAITAGSFVGPLTGTASQATVADTVKTISAGGTDAAFFVPMVDTQDSSSTAQTLVIDGGLTYNPSTNILDTTATAAQYADLAEVFPTDDLTLEPGDVVHFVGQNKVGKCDVDSHSSVAGVISTDPGFILNNASQGVKLAMTGRVPCKITGIIEPGDLLVSAGNGRARAESNPAVGTVIGKAIEAHNSTDTGVINIMITLM